jgi:hypothetical protein
MKAVVASQCAVNPSKKSHVHQRLPLRLVQRCADATLTPGKSIQTSGRNCPVNIFAEPPQFFPGVWKSVTSRRQHVGNVRELLFELGKTSRSVGAAIDFRKAEGVVFIREPAVHRLILFFEGRVETAVLYLEQRFQRDWCWRCSRDIGWKSIAQRCDAQIGEIRIFGAQGFAIAFRVAIFVERWHVDWTSAP